MKDFQDRMDSPYNKIAIIDWKKKTLSSQVFQLISSLFMSSTLRNFKWSTLVNRGRFLKQSAKKKSILELEVPEKETGIFFYDSYWKMIMGDHTNRANPDVLKIIENIMITLNGLYIRLNEENQIRIVIEE